MLAVSELVLLQCCLDEEMDTLHVAGQMGMTEGVLMPWNEGNSFLVAEAWNLPKTVSWD